MSVADLPVTGEVGTSSARCALGLACFWRANLLKGGFLGAARQLKPHLWLPESKPRLADLDQLQGHAGVPLCRRPGLSRYLQSYAQSRLSGLLRRISRANESCSPKRAAYFVLPYQHALWARPPGQPLRMAAWEPRLGLEDGRWQP